MYFTNVLYIMTRGQSPVDLTTKGVDNLSVVGGREHGNS